MLHSVKSAVKENNYIKYGLHGALCFYAANYCPKKIIK